MQKFKGTGVALVTPFTADKKVDTPALERLVAYQIANGINYLIVLGTTGEPATLTEAEKELVKATVVKANKGQLPLVLGVGGNCTDFVVAAMATTDLTGFDAILSVSPYYNKPTQEGIYQHFKAVSAASPLPIILYNVPGRTSSNMLPETVLRLATDCSNVIAVKEAAGDLVQAMQLLQHAPKDFLVISGDDMIALAMTLAGGAGVISVIAQGLPTDFSQMIALGLAGKATEAYRLQYKVADSIDYIFEEGNPAGIKAMLQELEICTDEVRLPLVKASRTLQDKIIQFINA